ncbi:MAG: bifunctional transaldolase/phosoglucose isomerase [Myxococcales bacterium]
MKPSQKLNEVGQSPWLDLIGRKLIHSGELLRFTAEEGIRGVTANPAIFEKAIVESDEYDDELARLVEGGRTPMEIYETLAVGDVRAGCDVLRPLFERLGGKDGFVSLEVSPFIARDTRATVEEAKRFWKAVDRTNLFIKIPANPEGIPAIREATAAGISVNITLIFSNTVYQQVIDAYMAGLEDRLAKGLPVAQIHSVASFFVSRVDSAVDKLLEQKGEKSLLGKIAVANAKEAYQVYLRSIATPRWKALEAKGATRQRPLWASTGTKNKAYSDVLYVETLIGRETVNTMPLATLQAFNDHGKAVPDSVLQGVDEARAQLARLGQVGVDLEAVCRKLTDEGLELFSTALTNLLHAIGARSEAQRFGKAHKVDERLGRRKDAAEQGLKAAAAKKVAARLWAKDPTLWSTDPKHQEVAKNRLGWLEVTQKMRHDAFELASFAKQAAQRFRHCLLLGMGGSSLCPDVLARVFGKQPGGLDLRVLDSTAPDAVRRSVEGFDLSRTLFLVSSKSGTTTEVNSFYRHFRKVLDGLEAGAPGQLAQRDAKSQSGGGSHFVAITDPGSPLHQLAQKEGFWRTWVNPPEIGGRYSALSFFGLVPAALLGLDVGKLLDEADRVALASHARVPLEENLAVRLGAIAGGCARAKCDKLTLLSSPRLRPFGAWVEQLVAESTGKNGRGILPVDAEPPGPPEVYGNDRLFVALWLAGEHAPEHERAVQALAEAGHPVIRWEVAGEYGLAGEFLRWEIATAVMGAILELDPFDEPDVAVAKEKTKELLSGGKLPPAEPALRGGGLALFCSPEHAGILRKAAGTLGGDSASSAVHWIAAHLALGHEGEYVAQLGYVVPDDGLHAEFSRLQGEVRDATGLACTFGFGPRYLHSTGQLHKGGPSTGVFLQATVDGGADIPIPGQPYGFATLFAAQARGDLEVLQARGRRVLRVHVEDGDPRKFVQVVREALGLIRE